MKSAVILNGGKSSRLGIGNKGLLKFGGKSIIERTIEILNEIFDETIIISNNPQGLENISQKYSVYPDMIESIGPLSGIYTGLSYIKSDWAFFCPCDMPFLNRNLIKELTKNIEGFDAVCPILDKSIQPLCAIYNKSCIPYIKALIHTQNYSIKGLLDITKVNTIDVSALPAYVTKNDFFNIATWDDYLKAFETYESDFV